MLYALHYIYYTTHYTHYTTLHTLYYTTHYTHYTTLHRYTYYTTHTHTTPIHTLLLLLLLHTHTHYSGNTKYSLHLKYIFTTLIKTTYQRRGHYVFLYVYLQCILPCTHCIPECVLLDSVCVCVV